MEMINQLEAFILSTLQTIFDQFGWAGVFGMMVFENATGITPSEIILAFAGWMLISAHELHPSMILLGGLYAGLGSAVGASLAYWLARLGGRPVVDRFAKLARIDLAYIDAAEAQFQRWGPGLVLIGRVIPGIRTLVSIPAGLARMSFPVFFLATFSGAYVWCTLLVGAGYFLGHEWALISEYVKASLPYLFGLGLAALAGYFLYMNRARFVPARAENRQD
jgi:membrane protein DedA with SNARE-associated domain